MSAPLVRAAGATRKSPKHKLNEDSFRLLDDSDERVRRVERGVLFAVADGVSTVDQGKWASSLAVERLEQFFEPRSQPVVNGLSQLIGEIDWEIRGSGDGKGACTLVALWLMQGTAHLLSVGDSEIFRLRKGQLQRMTGQRHGRRLDHYLGMGPDVSEVLKVRSEPYDCGDVYMLMSDGVTEVMKPLDLSCAWEGFRGSPSSCAESIVRQVDHREGTDDATVVVVEVL